VADECTVRRFMRAAKICGVAKAPAPRGTGGF
jgi:hypothetical protein